MIKFILVHKICEVSTFYSIKRWVFVQSLLQGFTSIFSIHLHISLVFLIMKGKVSFLIYRISYFQFIAAYLLNPFSPEFLDLHIREFFLSIFIKIQVDIQICIIIDNCVSILERFRGLDADAIDHFRLKSHRQFVLTSVRAIIEKF